MTDDPARPKPRTAPIDLGLVALPTASPIGPPFLADVIAPAAEPDGIGHVSNIEYLRWLDRAAELHTDALGYTRRRLVADGVMWFVARHEIDYVAEAHPGDALVIATGVRDVARVKSWRDSCIVRPEDGTVVCRAASLWVLVSLATRRPVRIPEPMRTGLLAPVLPGPAGEGERCTSV